MFESTLCGFSPPSLRIFSLTIVGQGDLQNNLIINTTEKISHGVLFFLHGKTWYTPVVPNLFGLAADFSATNLLKTPLQTKQ